MIRGGRRYVADPTYPLAGSARLRHGWESVSALVPEQGVLAIDGPVIVDWEAVMEGLGKDRVGVTWVDMREAFVSWEQVLTRTAPHDRLRGDPDFATVPRLDLAGLFDELPTPSPDHDGLTVVLGPGAALVAHDTLWYVDLPKRYAEAAVAGGGGLNLGAPETEPATSRRLFYIDWPLLDRHRDERVDRVDCWIDLRDPAEPTALDGATLRASVDALVRAPFRTRPTFNSTSWGGHWGQRELGFNAARANTALGYELIAPESGVLLGPDADHAVELPFQVVVALHPAELMGAGVQETFGTCFPIRFDYLDTVDGGNLSVHCHPGEAYMRDVFGVQLPQHETYYVMVGSPESVVFLGLDEGVDVLEFQAVAQRAHDDGDPFEIDRYVQRFAADEHQLFMIPAGTPHGSGRGNVVLEISATPYLYSLRFYDWLRRDARGRLRPVHVDHAFINLDTERTGHLVRDELVPRPRRLAGGHGWREELLGSLPEMFFEVRRLELGGDGVTVAQSTDDRFHVLNVVDGAGVLIRAAGAEHALNFAETMVVPATVGEYQVTAIGDQRTRLVKAVVA